VEWELDSQSNRKVNVLPSNGSNDSAGRRRSSVATVFIGSYINIIIFVIVIAARSETYGPTVNISSTYYRQINSAWPSLRG